MLVPAAFCRICPQLVVGTSPACGGGLLLLAQLFVWRTYFEILQKACQATCQSY